MTLDYANLGVLCLLECDLIDLRKLKMGIAQMEQHFMELRSFPFLWMKFSFFSIK